MKVLLETKYGIQIHHEIIYGDRIGYEDNQYAYFTILMANSEVIYMEQVALVYYLKEQGFTQIAVPIKNRDGNFITYFEEKEYMVVAVNPSLINPMTEHGEILANFHNSSMAYHYEPKSISSYGLWKTLWIDKLMLYETHLSEAIKQKPNPFNDALRDILPYLIGISENAIQYIDESATDQRYTVIDKPIIGFRRYRDQLMAPIIWPQTFVYDHPARDLAEFIRGRFLNPNPDALAEVQKFIADYLKIRPLTIFSWRLIYARLIYPAHIFDAIAELQQTASNDIETATREVADIYKQQARYEYRLSRFFELMKLDASRNDIPELDWLKKG